MERLLRPLAVCENVFAILGSLVFVFIVLAVCAEVVLRYGFNSPITWVVEISEYGLLWITFLGTSWVLREGGHVRVDILLHYLSPAALRICGLLSAASGAATSVVLMVFGTQATLTAFARGSFKPTGIDIPSWMVLVVIPLGGTLLFCRFAALFVEYFARKRDFGAEQGH